MQSRGCPARGAGALAREPFMLHRLSSTRNRGPSPGHDTAQDSHEGSTDTPLWPIQLPQGVPRPRTPVTCQFCTAPHCGIGAPREQWGGGVSCQGSMEDFRATTFLRGLRLAPSLLGADSILAMEARKRINTHGPQQSPPPCICVLCTLSF